MSGLPHVNSARRGLLIREGRRPRLCGEARLNRDVTCREAGSLGEGSALRADPEKYRPARKPDESESDQQQGGHPSKGPKPESCKGHRQDAPRKAPEDERDESGEDCAPCVDFLAAAWLHVVARASRAGGGGVHCGLPAGFCVRPQLLSFDQGGLLLLDADPRYLHRAAALRAPDPLPAQRRLSPHLREAGEVPKLNNVIGAAHGI